MKAGEQNRLPRHRTTCLRRRGAPSTDAFSILELLIVLALVLGLMVLLYGQGSSRERRRQAQAACQQNLQTVYVALQLFANDHEGAFPVAPGAQVAEEPLSLLVPRYTAATAPFICPGSEDGPLPEGEPFARRKISYAYVMGRKTADAGGLLMSDAQVDAQPKSQGQPVFSLDGKKPGNNHGKFGGNFLFCDGRVQASAARASSPLVFAQGVVLLNPRP